MISYKRLLSVFLSVAAVVLLLPSARAVEGTAPDTSLTLTYHDDGTPITGAHLDLYQVARLDGSGAYLVTEEFRDYNVTIDPSDGDSWKTLAATLEGLVLRDGVKALASGETNAQGQLTFSGLEQGIYLVLGRSHSQGNRIYECRPLVVALPSYDSGTGNWVYHVEAKLKFTSRTTHDGPSTVERRVLKRWADEGHENERPQEITVLLLRNGAVYDRVTLNAGNSWRHTWTGLDRNSQWTIVEEEEGPYTVSVSREGVTFVVTNTYPDEPPPPPDEDIPDDDVPLAPPPPDEDVPEEDIPDDDIPLTDLPKTGQLWWPVPALFSAGLLLVVLGTLRFKEGSQ